MATHDPETDNSESDADPDIDFIEESVRHLTVRRINVNRVSDYDKTLSVVTT